MKFDVTVFADDLNEAAALAQSVEARGFDGLWVAEAAHNPFLPLAHAARATQRISLGTAIAVAFPREPHIMARTAWDLAQASQGRFILGLGTQIKPHITKRFSAKWGRPARQMREYIQVLRQIWHGYRGGDSPGYQGDYYRLDAGAAVPCADALEVAEIPIYIAGVNTGLARLAGQVCDGFHVHSFHTPRYLSEVLLPAFREGRARSQLSQPLSLSCAVFVVTGADADEIAESKQMTKAQIAFYASTPSYRRVLKLHGWADIVPRLNLLLRRSRWDELSSLISDAMLEEFALVAEPADLPYMLRERYGGLLDRAGYYFPFELSDKSKDLVWRYAADAMRGGER